MFKKTQQITTPFFGPFFKQNLTLTCGTPGVSQTSSKKGGWQEDKWPAGAGGINKTQTTYDRYCLCNNLNLTVVF